MNRTNQMGLLVKKRDKQQRRQQAGKLESLGGYFVDGFVNGIAIGEGGRYVVAAVGREHRRGRWRVMKGAKDGVTVKDMTGGGEEEEEDDVD